jgi:MSHA biogenesis protein MshQ
VAKNFGQEDDSNSGTDWNERIQLIHSLIAPSGGQLGALTVEEGGSGVADATLSNFSNGVASGKISFNEVGQFGLSAKIKNLSNGGTTYNGYKNTGQDIASYYVGDVAANAVADRIDSSLALAIGRIIPSYFTASLNTPILSPPSGCSSFAYTGQAFGYASGPTLTLTAKNHLNITTQNYEGAPNSTFVKFPATLAHTYVNNIAGTTLEPVSAANLTTTAFANGVGVYTLSAETLRYSKTAVASLPFNADFNVELSSAVLTDGDGVKSQVDAATSAAVGATQQVTSSFPIRYGRLQLFSASGSELEPLSMTFQTEYWSGSSPNTGYVVNTQDSSACNQVVASDFVANITDTRLDIGDLTAAPTIGGFVFGSGSYTPGFGAFTLTQTPAEAIGQSLVIFDAANNRPWLHADFDGNGALDNPQGVSSFGAYSGIDMFINVKENYR